MKKLVALILSTLMLVSVLAACGEKTPKEVFEEQEAKMLAVDDYTAEITGSFELKTAELSSLLSGIEADENAGSVLFNVNLFASVSYTNRQLMVYGDVAVESGEDSMSIKTASDKPLLIIDDTVLYFNYSKFFEYLIGFCMIEDAEYSDYFDKEYITLDLSEEGNLWEKPEKGLNFETMSVYKTFAEKAPNMASILLRIYKQLTIKLNSGAYKIEDEYTLTIDKDIIFSVLDYVATNMDTNRELYRDAILEYLWMQTESELVAQGTDDATIEANHEEFISSYSSYIEAFIPYVKTAYDEFDKESFPEITVKIGLSEYDEGIYGSSVTVRFGEFINARFDIKMTESEQKKLTPPESVLDSETLSSLLAPNGIDSVQRKMIVKITDYEGNSKVIRLESDEAYFLDALYMYDTKILGLSVDEEGAIYIESIDGRTANAEEGEYWILYKNGQETSVYELSSHGAVYELSLEKYIVE